MPDRSLIVYNGSDSLPANDYTEDTDWEQTELAASASEGEASAGQWILRDEGGVQPDSQLSAFTSPHSVTVVKVGSNTLWRGRIAGNDKFRDRQVVGRAHELKIMLEDQNSHLRGIIVHDWVRPIETDVVRAQALVTDYLSGSPRVTTNLSNTYLITGSNTVALPAKTYYGVTPYEIMQELASTTNKQFFVTIDNQLAYFGTNYTGYSSLLRISDNLADANSTTFAPINPRSTVFSRDTLSAIRSYWGNDQATDSYGLLSPGVESTFDYWEDVFWDSDSVDWQEAQLRAQSILANRIQEDLTFTCSIGPLTGDDVWKIKVGQSIQFKSLAARSGRAANGTYPGDSFATVWITALQWSMPAPDTYFAALELNRPKLATRGSKGLALQPTSGCRNLLLNLASGSIKVSSTDGGNVKTNVVDGDFAVASAVPHWSNGRPNGVDEAYWAADLGVSKSVQAFHLRQGFTEPGVGTAPEGATEMKIYGSDSGTAWSWLPSGNLAADPASNGWTLVKTITASTNLGSDTGMVTLTPATYRYWLLRASAGPAAGVGTGWNVQEFELWDCSQSATDTTFDNTGSGTTAENVQDAIDEADARLDALEAGGSAGGATIMAPYTFDTTTTDSDPGNGVLRLSNASQYLAVTVRADLLDANGADVTGALDALSGLGGTIRGYLRLMHATDSTKWLLATVSALASPSGYRNITVANVAKSANSPFANGDDILLLIDISGVDLAEDADITTQAFGDTASAGSSVEVAGAGHKHGMPSKLTGTLTIIIDGVGAVISTGVKLDIEIPFNLTFTGWTLLADQSGAIKIDLWADTYANYPPVDGDSITNAHEPEIAASGTSATDAAITDWSGEARTLGDTLRVNVDSVTSHRRVTLSLQYQRD